MKNEDDKTPKGEQPQKTGEVQRTPVRVSAELERRLEEIAEQRSTATHRVTREEVLREMILRGLELEEQEQAKQRAPAQQANEPVSAKSAPPEA